MAAESNVPHVCIFRLVVDLELHHRARVQSHHYSDEMARKSELEEYLPKCLSWHRIERFDEIDESHVGFQVVFLSLPQRIDDCKSSIDGTAIVAKSGLGILLKAAPVEILEDLVFRTNMKGSCTASRES